MHPHEIRSENPSKDKHIYCTKEKAPETNPRKAWQGFKDGVMELYPGH